MNKKALHVLDGEVQEVAALSPDGKRFFRSFELKRDGTPDKRSRGSLLGVAVKNYSYADGSAENRVEGCYVLIEGAESPEAIALRAKYLALKQQANEAKIALAAFYSSH
jgi:hypothetical protein